MAVVPVTHLATYLRSLGGVQMMLRRHLAEDHRLECPPRLLTLFEPDQIVDERAVGLGLTWRDSIASTRKKFRSKAAAFDRNMLVYHNLWGLHFLADLDGGHRRLGILHTQWVGLEPFLRAASGLLDGLLCVSEPLQALAKKCLPELAAQRTPLLPYPVVAPPRSTPRSPLGHRPIVLGYVGRLQKEQKRIDRFPALVAALEEAQIPVELEFLGDGPGLPWLRSRLAARPRIRFHGRQSGEAYWRILQRWDFVVFLSDYEGLPISLLEAMSVGVLPLYPRMGSGGDAYAAGVRADLLYEPGDFQQLTKLLRELAQMPAEQVEELRTRCRTLISPHLGNAYHEVFCDFVHWVSEAPRISRASFPRRPFRLADHCPFGILSRASPAAYYRRFD